MMIFSPLPPIGPTAAVSFAIRGWTHLPWRQRLAAAPRIYRHARTELALGPIHALRWTGYIVSGA